MAGKTRPLGHCTVEGHGTRCEVAREISGRSKGRSREKAEIDLCGGTGYVGEFELHGDDALCPGCAGCSHGR